MRLVLASASPRRAELLRAAGFDFDTFVPDVDEALRAGESPQRYVRRLAAEKSFVVASDLSRMAPAVEEGPHPPQGGHHGREKDGRENDLVVLGADTAIVVDGGILAKPADDVEAAAMLRRLSGRRHEVMTGISLRRGACELGCVETTGVSFVPLTDQDVAWYVASGEGRDKAGAYAIQGLASRFIPRIDGSYSNVVGLPVAAVVALLTEIRRR